jgi:hypothetical protein
MQDNTKLSQTKGSNTSINIKQVINSLINIMSLISYVKIVTNKQLFISESGGESNHVHPTGETWYTWHIRFSCQSTYTNRTLPAGGPRTW